MTAPGGAVARCKIRRRSAAPLSVLSYRWLCRARTLSRAGHTIAAAWWQGRDRGTHAIPASY